MKRWHQAVLGCQVAEENSKEYSWVCRRNVSFFVGLQSKNACKQQNGRTHTHTHLKDKISRHSELSWTWRNVVLEANYDSSVRHKCVLNLQSVSGHFLLLLPNTESELIMLLKDRLITYQGTKKTKQNQNLSSFMRLDIAIDTDV